jgi:hypothetical protein
LSAGFREKFQYNNLTATTAGHLAEIVTGQSWEELVRMRIIETLEMHNTDFTVPTTGPVTLSYHESGHRELLLSQRLAEEVTAPSGGSIHSTVEDMARWMLFNLSGGKVSERPLIQPQTLKEIHSSQVVARTDPACPTPEATYAMGWFVDTYNGRPRLAHGGYIHDVTSEVMLFQQDDICIVSFTNFGFPRLSRLLNEHTFDCVMGFKPVQTLEEKLRHYEEQVEGNRQRLKSVPRMQNTTPSHPLKAYVGTYAHAGYGDIEIQREGEALAFRRSNLVVPLEHWHYDAWIPQNGDFYGIAAPHAFDRASRFLFETNTDGEIAAVSIPLEPAVAAIRFEKQR